MFPFNIRKLLEETGLDVHISFNSPVKLPFLTYIIEKSKCYGSDFSNEIKQTDYIIELYTEERSEKTQKKLENVLNKYGISYEFTENYIKEESMFLVAYYIKITEKI